MSKKTKQPKHHPWLDDQGEPINLHKPPPVTASRGYKTLIAFPAKADKVVELTNKEKEKLTYRLNSVVGDLNRAIDDCLKAGVNLGISVHLYDGKNLTYAKGERPHFDVSAFHPILDEFLLP